MSLLQLFSLLFMVCYVNTWPSGAPESTCNTLSPGHGANRSKDPSSSPIIITQSQVEYQPGSPVQVTIKAPVGVSFRGLMIQAYNPSTGQPIGAFQSGRGLKVLDSCSAVTHMDRRGKRSAMLLWDPPGHRPGRVAFRGTIVERYSDYYEGLEAVPESRS